MVESLRIDRDASAQPKLENELAKAANREDIWYCRRSSQDVGEDPRIQVVLS